MFDNSSWIKKPIEDVKNMKLEKIPILKTLIFNLYYSC